MATVAQGLTGWRRLVALGLLLAGALSAGCVSLDEWVCQVTERPPTGAVFQIVTTWTGQLEHGPDPTRSGAQVPGLAGRLYLFGPEIGTPLEADGKATVDLYDETPRAAGCQPVLVERWNFDKDTLKLLLRKDTIGWGYTLFLPSWEAYRPDMTQVRVKVCYQPAQGSPLYTEHAMTLNAVQDFHVSSKSTPIMPTTPAVAAATRPGARPALPAASTGGPICPAAAAVQAGP